MKDRILEGLRTYVVNCDSLRDQAGIALSGNTWGQFVASKDLYARHYPAYHDPDYRYDFHFGANENHRGFTGYDAEHDRHLTYKQMLWYLGQSAIHEMLHHQQPWISQDEDQIIKDQAANCMAEFPDGGTP